MSFNPDSAYAHSRQLKDNNQNTIFTAEETEDNGGNTGFYKEWEIVFCFEKEPNFPPLPSVSSVVNPSFFVLRRARS